MRAIALLVAAVAIPAVALAQDADLPLPAGAKIVVDTYDGTTKTFAVFSARFPCEGYSFVTPESLTAAVPDLNLNQVKRDPKALAGKEYTTSNELQTISSGDIEKNHEGQSETSALNKVCGG